MRTFQAPAIKGYLTKFSSRYGIIDGTKQSTFTLFRRHDSRCQTEGN